MADIWNIVGELGIELHPDQINSIAAKIVKMKSAHDFQISIVSPSSGSNQSALNQLGSLWQKNPDISPLELAGALRGSSRTALILDQRESVELVWTGPSTGLVASRHTEQALLEIIASAKENLFLVSFVAYSINSVMTALQAARARNVRIDILVELSAEHGGRVNQDSITTFKRHIDGANFYTWKTEDRQSDRLIGAVHAKCAVADASNAFITSANLTNAAMELNMELGVLIRGGSIPVKLDRHLKALIATEIISPMP